MKTINETFDSTPQVIVGRIVAVHGERNADGFFPADTVLYDIDAAFPGNGIVRMARQIPQTRLFVGQTEIDAERLIGCSVIGIVVMKKVRWEFVEPPALTSCAAPLSRYGLRLELLQGGTGGIVQPGTPATPQPGTGTGTPTAPDMGEV